MGIQRDIYWYDDMVDIIIKIYESDFMDEIPYYDRELADAIYDLLVNIGYIKKDKGEE